MVRQKGGPLFLRERGAVPHKRTKAPRPPHTGPGGFVWAVALFSCVLVVLGVVLVLIGVNFTNDAVVS